MKIVPLFYKYQKYIKAFANTNFGKSYLGIPHDEKVTFLDEHGRHEFLGFEKEKPLFRGVFHPKRPYKKLLPALVALDIANDYVNILNEKIDFVIPHYLGLFRSSYLPRIYLTTDTINPDADPETNTVDGHVGRNEEPSDATFAGIRAAAGNNTSSDGVTMSVHLESSSTSPKYDRMKRLITLFNTQRIGPSGSVSSATYSLYWNANGGVAFSQSLVMTTSSPASNTALVDADYAQVGTVEQATGRIAQSSFTSAYQDFTLNATGLGNISKTGITKFGARFSSDFDNSAPTWVSNAAGESTFFTADNGSNKPKLTITYTPGFASILMEVF